MRTQQSVLFSILFLVFTTCTTAWPWPRWLPEVDSLVVRQNSDPSSNTTPPTASQTRAPSSSGGSRTASNTGSTITDPPSSTDASATNSGTDSGSKGTATTGSNKSSGKSSASKARTTSYDQRFPAGGVSLMTPAVTDGEQYYKIGDFVTFAFNFTSLLATPTAVNVVASCKANNQIYTLAANHTITNATQSVVWDTNGYQQTAVSDPLLTEKYTLIIYDAESSISAVSQPGYLAVYNQYTFGMYVPQAYTPLGEFICATCSGALSDMERKAIGMAIGVGLLTVLSFTWFVGGTGIIW